METTNPTDFRAYPKTPRLFREIVITEKIDGTNAQVLVASVADMDPTLRPHTDYAVVGDLAVRAGSRTRWISPGNDNYGFAGWVHTNAAELTKLGIGRHFGEWWGKGINRHYDRHEKFFSLFNLARWRDGATRDIFEQGKVVRTEALSPRPSCCLVVPELYRGPFSTILVHDALQRLINGGSVAAPGFTRPEGVVVFHTAANSVFKVLIENDGSPKGAE